ncbi:MAG TPA: NHL repeat-containing protein, partial [Candidatus Lokiarchaeia archaeon]|nr:NHL repeat-containing protein [Candidatus Lokiarchaeia archaeon]
MLTIGCGFALLPTFRNINAPPEANVLPARQLTTHEMGALPAPQVASFTDYLATIGTTGVQGNNSTCFSYPEGIATDRAGFVYVTDLTNYRVQIFSTAGNYLYTLGTTGQSGADNAHFGQPYDVAVNSTGYIYVTDFSNNRVQIFTPAWDYLTTISAGLNGPLGVTVDSNDFVYVMDQGHNLVKVFDNALHPMPSIGSGGGA